MRSRRTTPGPADIARPLNEPRDLDPLIQRIGGARYVLLGEASHGTHEYYRWRAELTRRLVEEHGFSFVTVEGDWPDCFGINSWVRHMDQDGRTAEDVLAGFERWPTWMWANREVAELVTWMRNHNHGRAHEEQVGFYGFDVYSLWGSLRAVMDYLAEHESDSLEAARQAVRCFEPYGEDPQSYAWASRIVPETCEPEVVALLGQMLEARAHRPDGGPEHRFAAEQNAFVARNAERYYRAMVRGGPDSWNVRDTHMVDTLERLMTHHGADARCIVWAHNTHIGDARATTMSDQGMVNVGQLLRERHTRDDVVTVGFTGHHGTVIAGDAWGSAMERMAVPPARQGSVEDLLHREVGHDALYVFPSGRQRGFLDEVLPHRAIGVVYDPRHERRGNYVPTVIGSRYDAVLSLDATAALRPLGPEAPVEHEELESFPHGV